MELYDGDKLLKDPHRDSHKELEVLKDKVTNLTQELADEKDLKKKRFEDSVTKLVVMVIGAFLLFIGALLSDYFKGGS